MRQTDEIIMKVESSWIGPLTEKELIPGEAIQVSLKASPKPGMLVFVANCDKNYITYYRDGMEGNVYTILSIKSCA